MGGMVRKGKSPIPESDLEFLAECFNERVFVPDGFFQHFEFSRV